jgi:hypothetical protein
MARKRAESAGSRLKREILAKYQLDPAEGFLLDRAAAMADALERIEGEVAAVSLTTSGSTGQRVAEPLLMAQREHAGQLAALLAACQLPGRDELTGASATSKAAQRAAHVRWAREKQRG